LRYPGQLEFDLKNTRVCTTWLYKRTKHILPFLKSKMIYTWV